MCALVTGVQTYARPISCNRDDDVRLRPIALFEYISELGEADLELCRTGRQSRAIFCDRRVRLLAQANEIFTRTIETVSKGIELQPGQYPPHLVEVVGRLRADHQMKVHKARSGRNVQTYLNVDRKSTRLNSSQ